MRFVLGGQQCDRQTPGAVRCLEARDPKAPVVSVDPTGKAVSVFVIHWGGRSRETLTLCHVAGSWEEQLEQLAAGRKIEAM